MAVTPHAIPGQRLEQDDDDDDFTFPTPPPPLAGARAKNWRRAFHPPCTSASSSPPVCLTYYCPIRRSFSDADCAASPWRAGVVHVPSRRRLSGACSPALSDYAGGFCDDGDEEEERMDRLWEDLNDDGAAGDGLFLGSPDVSVGGPGVAGRTRKAAKERGAAVLGAYRSLRRRPPGLVAMMHAFWRLFVAQMGRNKAHRDEQSTASASADSSSCSNPSRK